MKTNKQKELKCLSIAEWINILWFVYTTENYTGMKMNKLQQHIITWLKSYKRDDGNERLKEYTFILRLCKVQKQE